MANCPEDRSELQNLEQFEQFHQVYFEKSKRIFRIHIKN